MGEATTFSTLRKGFLILQHYELKNIFELLFIHFSFYRAARFTVNIFGKF